jgi:hypothetical protein
MRKMIILLLISLWILPSCLDDPIIVPDTLEARLIFYNNLLETDKVVWDINDVETISDLAYGVPAEGVVEVEDYSQQVRFDASTLDGEVSLGGFDYAIDPYRYYLISVLGTEQDPFLVYDTIDTSFPTLGLVKMRFLQASEAMGDVDIYVGGELPEHLKLQGVNYKQLTPYVESTQEAFWNAVIVTPAQVAPADSIILSYEVNNNFIPNRTYFGVINHTEADPESAFRMQVFNQPSY